MKGMLIEHPFHIIVTFFSKVPHLYEEGEKYNVILNDTIRTRYFQDYFKKFLKPASFIIGFHLFLSFNAFLILIPALRNEFSHFHI